MKRVFWWGGILAIILILLSACMDADGNSTESLDNEESNEISSSNIPAEDPIDNPKNDIDEYLLASGMACIEKLDQVFSDFESASPQIESTVRAFRENKTFSAVLIPFQTSDVTETLHLNTSGYYEFLPEYLNAYALHNLFYWSYTAMDTDDDIDEWTCFSSVSSHIAIPAPDNKSESWVLPVFYGDISNPEVGVLVTFDTSGDNLIAVDARCFGHEIAKYLVNNCQDWLKQGNCYTSEELIQIEDDFDISSTQVSKINISDMNHFLIETAVQLNSLFYQDLISEGVKEYAEQSGDINYVNIEEIAASTNKFDVGIIIPADTETYRSTEYPLSTWSLSNLEKDTFKLYPLPENWTEDVCVILGSQQSICYGKIVFRSGVDIFNNNVLSVGYESIPIEGADKFMKGFAEGKVPYDSLYGDWTEYSGIQNIKYVEPEIDPNDYYDYLLCSGGGYSIVAKQVETVTDSWVEIGVLNDSYDWIIDMAADTPLHSNGRLPDPNGYIHFASICNQMDDYIHYSGNGIFIYARPKMTLNGHDFYEVTSWNILENTSYEFSRLITKTFTLQNGYIIMMDDSYFDSHSGNVLIMNDKGEFIQTDIYCGSTTYLGQYAEGVFFSYDGFYDIDGKLVIDLSEYAGLINNNPTFVNGQCKLTAVNPNGVEFNAVLNIDGTFVSEFTRTD